MAIASPSKPTAAGVPDRLEATQRSEIAMPLRSRSAITPTCRPLKCKMALIVGQRDHAITDRNRSAYIGGPIYPCDVGWPKNVADSANKVRFRRAKHETRVQPPIDNSVPPPPERPRNQPALNTEIRIVPLSAEAPDETVAPALRATDR